MNAKNKKPKSKPKIDHDIGYPASDSIDRMKARYVRVVKLGGSWNVFLQIDHQGFSVVEQTDKKRADWYAKMLGIALERLVRNEEGRAK